MIRNIVIVFVLWLVFVGGLWAHNSRRRSGLSTEPVDFFFCWAAILYLGALLIQMIFQAVASGEFDAVP